MEIFKTSVLSAALLFTGCDEVDTDNRYIFVEPVEPVRKVLIEDFTGQYCVNCPEAHNIIHLLEQQYPGAIIPVAIHGGDFAIKTSETNFESDYVGLASDDAIALNNKFQINEWPSGLIDRVGGVKKYDQWATYVKNEIEHPSMLNINIEAFCEENSISATITLEPLSNIIGKLNVWIVENNIVARQRSASGNIRDYVHDNVLRKSLSDINGIEIALKEGIHTSHEFHTILRYDDQERWIAENLSIIAFVETSDGIEQVNRSNVKLSKNISD